MTSETLFQMIAALEKASGKKIPYEMEGRREGDIASVYCDPRKAREELGWTAQRGLDQMCQDLWTWQSSNPNGFRPA